jgi:hypothetical protein
MAGRAEIALRPLDKFVRKYKLGKQIGVLRFDVRWRFSQLAARSSQREERTRTCLSCDCFVRRFPF